MQTVLIVLIAFVTGSFPTGYLMGRVKGIDLRKYGSGATGATNALRVLGPWYAAVVALLDIAKGGLATFIGLRYAGLDPVTGGVLAGLAAVVGHNWSPFLGFTGGRGVATATGVAAVLLPIPLLWAVGVFVGVIALTRWVSLGSLCGALTLGLATLALPVGWTLRAFAWMAVVFIFVRHRANIARLLAGTESRLGERVKVDPGR